jgi:hypothetical protein
MSACKSTTGEGISAFSKKKKKKKINHTGNTQITSGGLQKPCARRSTHTHSHHSLPRSLSAWIMPFPRRHHILATLIVKVCLVFSNSHTTEVHLGGVEELFMVGWVAEAPCAKVCVVDGNHDGATGPFRLFNSRVISLVRFFGVVVGFHIFLLLFLFLFSLWFGPVCNGRRSLVALHHNHIHLKSSVRHGPGSFRIHGVVFSLRLSINLFVVFRILSFFGVG